MQGFLKRYQAEIEKMKAFNFENMTLEEGKKFMEESYILLQKLAYDRFKYALFPSVLNNKKFDKIIKKVNKKYSSFDFYWDLENRTSVVADDIYKIAYEIRKDKRLNKAIISGEAFRTLCEKYEKFKQITDKFMEDNGFKSDYNCYCLAAKTFMEEPDRLLNIVRPILDADENSDKREEAKDFSNLMKSLEKIYGTQYPEIENK